MPTKKPDPLTHYSVLGRVTLCGKDIAFKLIKFTDIIDLCDCPRCVLRYRERVAKISGM